MHNAFENPQLQPNPKKETTINRVINKSKEKEEEIMQMVEAKFSEKNLFAHEREKTENECQIIEYLMTNLPAFVARYGGEPVNFTQDDIHVFDPRTFTHDFWKTLNEHYKGANGLFYTGFQGVLMFMRFQEDDVEFADVCTHELMHLNSFQSIQKLSEEDDKRVMMIERRMGLGVNGKNKENDKEYVVYLDRLSEAVTEELSMRFAAEHFPNMPGIAEGMDQRRILLPDMSDLERYTSSHVHVWKKRNHETYYKAGGHKAYQAERNDLNAIIDVLYDKRSDEFTSREDVFAVFARAYFTGNIMPMVRLYDDVYGAGSFVAMARQDKIICDPSVKSMILDKKNNNIV